MFTANEMRPAVGRQALLYVEGLSFTVRIKDVRQVFDRVDCLVEPMDGDGEKWVGASRLSLIHGKQGGVVVQQRRLG